MTGGGGRRLRAAVVVAVVAAGPLALAACGSAPATASVGPSCQAVSAVLSDGPDPQADPVGYAEAQVGPLRQLAIPNDGLRAAVKELAAAYARYFRTDGAGPAVRALDRAGAAVDAYCPGVTG